LATALLGSHTPLNEAQGWKNRKVWVNICGRKFIIFSLGRRIHGERRAYDV